MGPPWFVRRLSAHPHTLGVTAEGAGNDTARRRALVVAEPRRDRPRAAALGPSASSGTVGSRAPPSHLAPGAEPAALANETFVRTLWPGRDPLARCVKLERADPTDGPPQPCRPVVGVFRVPARAGLAEARALAVAVLLQPGTPFYRNTRALVVRVAGDPAAAIPAFVQGCARGELRAAD